MLFYPYCSSFFKCPNVFFALLIDYTQIRADNITRAQAHLCTRVIYVRTCTTYIPFCKTYLATFLLFSRISCHNFWLFLIIRIAIPDRNHYVFISGFLPINDVQDLYTFWCSAMHVYAYKWNRASFIIRDRFFHFPLTFHFELIQRHHATTIP